MNDENYKRQGSKTVLKDPRMDSKFLKALRLIHKTLRIIYVCWAYYFMPLLSLFISFAINQDFGLM